MPPNPSQPVIPAHRGPPPSPQAHPLCPLGGAVSTPMCVCVA